MLNSNSSKSTSYFQNWFADLHRPVDGSSLAAFRIIFSLIMVLSIVRAQPLITEFASTGFHFPFFPGLPAPTVQIVSVLTGLIVVCLFNVALGVFYRTSCGLVCAALTYFIIADKSYYQNQIYLAALFALLLFMVPANNVFSLGASDQKISTVPRWGLVAFRLQLAIINIFVAISDLNTDWINGYPQLFWMMKHHRDVVLGPLLSQPWSLNFVTYAAIAINLLGGAFLIFERTAWAGCSLILIMLAFSLPAFFHNAFPWLILAALTLLAPPQWPRALNNKLRITSVAKKFGLKFDSTYASESESDEQTSTIEPKAAKVTVSKDRIGIFFFHLYIAAQILIPLRQFFYPGNMSWSELGSRFSWARLIPTKQLISFKMTMTSTKGGDERIIDPALMMSEKQYRIMWSHPDLIVQFAHYIANEAKQKTGFEHEVKVKAVEALYGRASQNLIDESINLADQPIFFLKPKWLVQLKSQN